jgi:hypothetical protein
VALSRRDAHSRTRAKSLDKSQKLLRRGHFARQPILIDHHANPCVADDAGHKKGHTQVAVTPSKPCSRFEQEWRARQWADQERLFFENGGE